MKYKRNNEMNSNNEKINIIMKGEWWRMKKMTNNEMIMKW